MKNRILSIIITEGSAKLIMHTITGGGGGDKMYTRSAGTMTSRQVFTKNRRDMNVKFKHLNLALNHICKEIEDTSI